MTRLGQLWPPDDRPDLGAYTVAFSFAGERIEDGNVRKIAEAVEAALLPGEVFFDEFFEPRVRQGPTRDNLDDIYRNRSALAVRFLCTDYRDKRWPQGESIAITSRHPRSILDLQATEVSIDGLAGARSFPFKSHIEPNKCVEQILFLAREILESPLQNKNEYRTKITVFEALALIDKLKLANISHKLLASAVLRAGFKWPSKDNPATKQLSWWINKCRNFSDDQYLTKVLHGVWPAIKEYELEINEWYGTVFDKDFERPKTEQLASPVMQITREHLGTKGEPRLLLNFDLVRDLERQSSGVLECKPVELPSLFPDEFRKLERLAQTRQARVELVLPLSELHGQMQSMKIQYGESQYSPLCLRFPTVVRSHKRTMYGAPTHEFWQTQSAVNLELYFCGCPKEEFWEIGLAPTKVWLFSAMQSDLVCGRSVLNELVVSGVPIAIWYINTECDWATQPLQLAPFFADRAATPEQVRKHRISHGRLHPNSDVVLLFEDPNIPIRLDSELENTELEAQT